MKARSYGLFTELAGPGLAKPAGRRRTFFEAVMNAFFRLACLAISLMALLFVSITGGIALLLIAGAIRAW